MTLNEQVKRKMKLCPVEGAKLKLAWDNVWARIEATANPKMKNFEVHHMRETARKAIFEAFVDGHTDLEEIALASIGLKQSIGEHYGY